MRFRFGDYVLDDQRFSLTGPDGAVHVEPQVFELLRYLVEHRERVVPKEELLDSIWGDRFVSESALTSRVKAARRAVGDDGQAQRVIKTVHGRGYQFVAEAHDDGTEPATSTARPPARSLPHLRIVPLGRDADIDRVATRLGEGRLVTITGPGGIGKTTVALAVAQRLGTGFADGVVFADLLPVPPRSDITPAVAAAAGVEGAAAASLDALGDHLAGRPTLLLLDNCEHVLPDVRALVDRLLARPGPAHVLATSREPLGLPGEHLWPLGSLDEAAPLLFVERARAAEPRVEWDPADPAIVDLCRRLDGLPLALELAAGQLRRFDLADLRRHLDDRLSLLAARAVGDGDGDRHATMEAAIDWSYRLLEPDEQRLLAHLSVFPASFEVAAVEGSAPELSGRDVVTVLGDLVDKSLVVRLPGSGRYRLLETIRVFARTHLEDAGDLAGAHERHRRHVHRSIASTSRLDRWFSGRRAAGLRLGFDDVRQAFTASLERGRPGEALEVALGASFLWRNAVGCVEGRAWTDRLAGTELAPGDQLWVHLLQADVGQGSGDHRRMSGAASAARSLVADVDDPAGACLARHYGALTRLTTEPDRARVQLADALELAHRTDDPRLATLVESFLAVTVLTDGRHGEVADAVDRLIEVASPDGYDRFIVHWTGWLLGLAERDAATTRRWMDRQQAFLDRTGIVETWLSAFSSSFCDVLEGTDIVPVLARTLDLADREGYDASADCLLPLAYAELCAGRVEPAAELIGTAMAGRVNATAHLALYWAVLDRLLRQDLDEPAVAAAMERGRSVTPSDALAAHGVSPARPADPLSSS